MNGNTNIKCSVTSCRHHAGSCGCCSLDSVSIGTHETHPTKCECTDCLSFELK